MRLVLCLLAGALAGAEPADPALALRLPAAGPELAAAASAWQAEALLERLADSDPARRRGAARLAAALPVPADRLLAALLASPDREVRRLGAAGLRGCAVAPADLARLPDPDLIAILVAEHPSADPLADPALKAAVQAWTGDPARCRQAAQVIACRGSTAAWSEALVQALENPDAEVAAAAHDALQALTRTQRSLDAYAGDRRLLAQDWRDVLAAKPAATRHDPELMALVAELPAPEALATLLARGAPAVAAVESAQADATRARRRELEPAARLLAHGVPAGLYAALGAAAFAELDSAAPEQRIACLRALVGEIRKRADSGGLAMLVCALDDADTTVRATVLDQLVRLSDDARSFRRQWRIAADSLFQPEHTVRRLRRCLREGAADEQIAALLLVGSLSANDLADDVLPLLLSPRDDVVGTALETINRLHAGPKQVPVLARLGADRSLPAARRVLAIAVLGEIMQNGSYDSNRANPGLVALPPLLRLLDDPEPRVATAAAQALATGRTKGAILRSALEKLIARGLLDAAVGIADDSDEPEVLALLVARVLAGAGDADRAALILAEGLAGHNDRKRTSITTATGKPELRSRLAAATATGQVALAQILGLIALADALPHLAAGDPELRDRALAVLALRTSAVGELALLAEATRHAPKTDRRAAHAIRRRALALAARSPDRLLAVLAGNHDLLDVASTSSSGSGGKRTRTLTLRDGGKLRLEAEAPKRDEWHGDDDLLTWRLVGPPPPGGPDVAGLQALAALLMVLPAQDDDERANRDLAVAWLAGSEPAAALTSRWQHDAELCQMLAAAWPAFREALLTRVAAELKPGESGLWRLRPWLRLDPVRLAPVATRLLLAEGSLSEWEVKPIMQAFAALPPERIAELLPDLLARPEIAKQAASVIARSGPLPLVAALSLAQGTGLSETQALAPIAAEAADTIATRLASWSPDEILIRAGSVRRLRQAGPAAVGAAMGRLIVRQDAVAAAWLRTGIPLDIGLVEPYRQAESSTVPELALVGSAFALKEGRLAPAAFLGRVSAWPSPVQLDAAAAAKRYCDGKWSTLAGADAAMVGKLGARALIAWIAVLPPSDGVVAALAERAADPATADAMGGALLQHLSREPAWRPGVQAIIGKAQGRLDWLRGSMP